MLHSAAQAAAEADREQRQKARSEGHADDSAATHVLPSTSSQNSPVVSARKPAGTCSTAEERP